VKGRNKEKGNADIGLLLCMAPEIMADPFLKEACHGYKKYNI
jgi:hypothetical protein